MKIRAFDKDKNPATIKHKNIISVKIINRRLCYFTNDGRIYYGSISLKEWAELNEKKNMVQVDKNSVINAANIKHVIKGIAYGSDGKKYAIARRNRSKFLDLWSLLQK